MLSMSEWTIPLDHDAISNLLLDPMITRMVTIVNLANLSILELLEYNFTRHDINRALVKGIIEFDKSTLPTTDETVEKNILAYEGDYYFKFLNSKVRLTSLGLYLLEILEGENNSQLQQFFPNLGSVEQLDLRDELGPHL
jgi:hypothetical protein